MPTERTMKSNPSSRKAHLPAFEPATEEQIATSPWKGPWWRPAPGEWPVLAWIILIHLTAVVGLVLVPLPGWGLFFLTLSFIWVGGIGTTVCYHRAITHRSLKLHPVVRQGLTFFAMFNGSVRVGLAFDDRKSGLLPGARLIPKRVEESLRFGRLIVPSDSFVQQFPAFPL